MYYFFTFREWKESPGGTKGRGYSLLLPLHIYMAISFTPHGKLTNKKTLPFIAGNSSPLLLIQSTPAVAFNGAKYGHSVGTMAGEKNYDLFVLLLHTTTTVII